MPRDEFSLPTLRIIRTGTDDLPTENPGRTRPLLHVHVPKCAGTALDLVMGGLSQTWGRPAIRFFGTIYGQGFSGLRKKEARKEAAGFTFPDNWFYASGHIPFGRFPRQGVKRNTVALVREPVSRVVSMFRMGVRREAWAPTASLKEVFGAGLLSPNSMVRQLSGETSKDAKLKSRHVDIAVRNFRSMTYTGRMDEFDSVLGSILADYGVRYVAYHSYRDSEPIDDREFERLGAEAAPHVELDQAFFDRVDGASRQTRTAETVSFSEIPAGTPVFLVSPFLVSGNGQPGMAKFVVAEQLKALCGD